MAPFSSLELEVVDGEEIRLKGDYQTSAWSAVELGQGNVLLSDYKQGGQNNSVGYCDADVLCSILYGLVRRQFTGSIELDVDGSSKTLFFDQGELVFAKSELMDDRLGEVIYRAGVISLDQMTNAAVAVSRERKFGKVLIESEDYNSADLWDFLKMQIRSIFQSVFLSHQSYFRILSEQKPPPVSIIFDHSTESMIEQCASFSQMFRGFLSRVSPEANIQPRQGASIKTTEGTSLGDTLQLIQENPKVGAFVEKSKLSEMNSYLVLFNLIVTRYVDIEGLESSVQSVLPNDQQRAVKGCIDSYHVALQSSQKAFTEAALEFPLEDLHDFVRKLGKTREAPIYLGADGKIAVESVRHLYDKGRGSQSQQKETVMALQSLIQFVLQITGDLLPRNGWEVKRSIQEMLL